MGRIRSSIAALLASLAFVAFQSDADAQARTRVTKTIPGTSRSSERHVSRQTPSRQSGTVKRQSSDTDRKPKADRPSSRVKPSVTRPSSRPSSGTAVRPSAPKKSDDKKVRRDKPTVRPDKPTVRPDRPSTRPERPSSRPDRPSVKPDKHPPLQIRPDHKPDRHRVHPHDRDFIVYDRPSHFWSRHDHCYGHRVRVLPAHVRRHIHHGVIYYCYNDIWYRPFGGYYVVCRPPFGTVLAANLIADMTWAAVRLSYYHTVANAYDRINENNEYIAQQNQIIAQNNAVIAAQNQAISMNGQLASQAYALANELGLVQSYADAGSNYFYQDGVFYIKDAQGEYKVIVPPAGALVDSLPEDYEIVTLNGDEYYKVDDTVYKVSISEGKPYFEVLGQLYTEL